MKITTANGFKCEINENALDDMRMLELLRKMDASEDATDKLYALLDILEKLLGAKGKDKLYEFCEKKHGRASTEAVSNELNEILKSVGEAGKKS